MKIIITEQEAIEAWRKVNKVGLDSYVEIERKILTKFDTSITTTGINILRGDCTNTKK